MFLAVAARPRYIRSSDRIVEITVPYGRTLWTLVIVVALYWA